MTAGTCLADTILSDGAIGYWRLNETTGTKRVRRRGEPSPRNAKTVLACV
jgi:hypothetical protein